MNLERSLTVLIVDDDSIKDNIYRQKLLEHSSDRFNFIKASFAQEGLNLCRHLQPDIVLLTYQLPDFNGLEFLKKLNRTETNPPPVIMLVESDEAAIAIEAIKSGAKGCMDMEKITPQELELILVITALFHPCQSVSSSEESKTI